MVFGVVTGEVHGSDSIATADISQYRLWWYYDGLDVNLGEVKVDAYLHQALNLTRLQRTLLDRIGHELTTY